MTLSPPSFARNDGCGGGGARNWMDSPRGRGIGRCQQLYTNSYASQSRPGLIYIACIVVVLQLLIIITIIFIIILRAAIIFPPLSGQQLKFYKLCQEERCRVRMVD